ncbi:polysaccharide deacetylase family protein [Bacteroidales bacterium OttesenSCG-928-M06]|nr:polysaccharide deacetylase family protein [Bacteroidales bacterium OttesenSCG-928-M06]
MNILTFDIEEWFVYQYTIFGKNGNYQSNLLSLLNRLLDELESNNLKATFFCLGVMARENPEVIKLIHSKKHEIACHSDKHRWLSELNASEFDSDTTIAVDSLEQVIGEKIKGYRAPAFSVSKDTLWVWEVLSKNGIEYDSSIYPSDRDFGGFPEFTSYEPSLIHYNGIKMKEFPIGLTKFLGKEVAYSGGGYFRLLPYFLIKKMTKENSYVMSYFHLRDFDVKQNTAFEFNLRTIKNYYGIKGAYSKFLNYLHDFEFINIGTADQMIDWEKKVPQINL